MSEIVVTISHAAFGNHLKRVLSLLQPILTVSDDFTLTVEY